MEQPKKENFLAKLYNSNKVSGYYKSLRFAFKEQDVYKSEDNELCLGKKSFVKVIIAFPQFLIPKFQSNTLRVRQVVQKKMECFGIVIDKNLNSIDDYLRGHFSKNSRTPVIKKKKRLESSFNISYKVYYGNIEPDVYENLISTCKRMLVERFEQRADHNHVLNNWEAYRNSLYTLINKKKASFFVIYNNNTPIQISVNYHYKTIMFAYIPAYDINYSKFGLGNTAVYMQLKWCIENKYEYLDFGNGNYDYKRRWCNYEYLLETHIICQKNSLTGNGVALLELGLVKLKNLLKDLNIDVFLQNLRPKANGSASSETFEQFNFIAIEEDFKPDEFEKISLDTDEFNFLKKPVFDFIYQYQDHFDSIKVYKENDTTFVIAGEKNTKKLTLE